MSLVARAGGLAAVLGVTALVGCGSTPNRAVRPDSRPMGAAPEVAEAPRAAAAPAEAVPGLKEDAAAGLRASLAQDPGGRADALVAVVEGREISVKELVSTWLLRDPSGLRGVLDDLVLSRLIVLEAGALGLEPPAADLERAVEARLDEVEAAARAAGAPDLATFVEARFGLEPDAYLRRINEKMAVEVLASRCIRSWLLRNDRREVRAISVDGRSAVDEVQARLARGEAFESVARDVSTDESSDRGGRLPALVRSDSVMARAAFATEVGARTGPVREGDRFLFLQVEAAPPLLDGRWAEVGPAVEASLEAQPVEDAEFWQWKQAMVRQYDVDTEPLLELIR